MNLEIITGLSCLVIYLHFRWKAKAALRLWPGCKPYRLVKKASKVWGESKQEKALQIFATCRSLALAQQFNYLLALMMSVVTISIFSVIASLFGHEWMVIVFPPILYILFAEMVWIWSKRAAGKEMTRLSMKYADAESRSVIEQMKGIDIGLDWELCLMKTFIDAAEFNARAKTSSEPAS